MRIFIKKITYLLGLLFLILGLVYMVNILIISSTKLFEVDPHRNILVLGDSHAKYAFNDKILKNTYNFSRDADSYFYCYLKLKKLTKENDQIDTLILSFSEHNIDNEVEKKWLLSDVQLQERLRIYFPLLEIEDIEFLLTNKSSQLLIAPFSQVLLPVYLVMKGRYVYGGYKDLNHNVLGQALKNNKRIEINQKYFTECHFEKVFLLKIVEFCSKKDIKLIIVQTPIHKTIQGNQKQLWKFYNKYLSGVSYVDFSKLELSDDCYGDLVHLSPKGALYFSELIKDNRGVINLAKKLNCLYN